MKKVILIIIILFSLLVKTNRMDAQIILSPNYVQNPSFEEYDTCPNSSGELYLSKHWWGLSTDYFNSCYFYGGGAGVPANFAGFQYAHTGFAYAGFSLYWHSPVMAINETSVEIIKNLLNDSLKKNTHYCINYYVSLADWTLQAALNLNSIIVYDSIGAMFSVNQIQDTLIPVLCDTCAKFAKSIASIDTLNWLKISGSVLANGGEKYLAIGKFNNMNWASNIYTDFYVYIDDVSVCECSFNFNLGNDTTLCNGQSLTLNPNLINTTYIWQDGSTNSTYTVTQAGTYWVKAYFSDYNITTTDTINIMYKDCEDTLIIPNIFTPNGDNINDYFVIKNSNNWDINVQVFNRWGNEVYKADNYQNNWDGKSKGNPLADGVYYYIINAKGHYTGTEKEYHGSLTILR